MTFIGKISFGHRRDKYLRDVCRQWKKKQVKHGWSENELASRFYIAYTEPLLNDLFVPLTPEKEN